MEQPQRKQNPLETEPIGRLIRRYSIPTALTLMVNYLYNIVDQIFVGQGVGVTGMAATNVAFPLTIVTIALALMIGDGCAANMKPVPGPPAARGGGPDRQPYRDPAGGCGGFPGGGGEACSPGRIVLLFGATETAFQASLDYTRIIVWGLPFLLFSSALTAIIRADGNPKYTMKCMILGAVINTVLDPVFIFGLHMGVVGAAIATVIGQVAGRRSVPGLPAAASVGADSPGLAASHGGPHGRIFKLASQFPHADYDRCRSGDHEQPDDPVWGPDGLWRGCGAFGLWHGDEGVPDCPRHVCGGVLGHPAHQRL